MHRHNETHVEQAADRYRSAHAASLPSVKSSTLVEDLRVRVLRTRQQHESNYTLYNIPMSSHVIQLFQDGLDVCFSFFIHIYTEKT